MKSQLERVPAVNRRRFMQTAAIGAAGLMGSLAGPEPGLAHGDDFPRIAWSRPSRSLVASRSRTVRSFMSGCRAIPA
jgi:hypothetical protein